MTVNDLFAELIYKIRAKIYSILYDLGLTKRKKDHKYIKLVFQAYRREINCYRGQIRFQDIKPFSIFHMTVSDYQINEFVRKVAAYVPPPILVYQNGDKFILSDDYTKFEIYKVLKYKYIPAYILGETSNIKIKNKIGPVDLPPPGEES